MGGTGAAKCGGNYAASLIAQEEAYANGCKQVCFLDDVTASHIEELGGMNVFVVRADGSVVTPRLAAPFWKAAPARPSLSYSRAKALA